MNDPFHMKAPVLPRSGKWRSTPSWPGSLSIAWIVVAHILVVGCAGTSPSAGESNDSPEPSVERDVHRDIDELQRVKYSPRACERDTDCPDGSHCDDDARTCTWHCLADSDCGTGKVCNAIGECTGSWTAHLSNSTPACQRETPASRREAALAVRESEATCFTGSSDDSDDCACGAYCKVDGVCWVDCLQDNPPPDYTCTAGKTCSPSGRCIDAIVTPPSGPPLQVSLEISPPAVAANTVLDAVSLPLTVRIKANSLDVLQNPNNHPAVVRYSFAGFALPDRASFPCVGCGDPPPGGPAALVRCTAAGAFSDHCELAGGWTFDVGSGSLVSQPRTIWVQVPQSPSPLHFTLVARSEWAEVETTASVDAAPVTHPAASPGHYVGTVTWPGFGSPDLSLPVEAFVTNGAVALYEPSAVLLPDGHVDLSRVATKSTLLGWLRSSSDSANRYDVRLKLGTLTYTQATGQLMGSLTLTNGTGGSTTALPLALQRTGDVTAATCSISNSNCSSGKYCDKALNLCLAGTGAAAGAGIVDDTAAPSTTLVSTKLAAWAPAVATLASDPLLSGAGLSGMGRAYCYQAGESVPAAFGLGRTLSGQSQDLRCRPASVLATPPYDQTTFAFVNALKEIQLDSNLAQTFNLFEGCRGDLGIAPPAGTATRALLDASKPCASVPQFFLAMNANVDPGTGLVRAMQLPQAQMATQILRQWLGANAYLASSAVQNKTLDEALGSAFTPTHVQLGDTLDLVDQDLRVLLDPKIRPQFAAGPAAAAAAVTPDYRGGTQSRPVAHWRFNTFAGPDHDTESGADFELSGVDLSTSRFVLAAGGTLAACHTTGTVALADTQFTLSFAMGSHIHRGPMTIFKKTATDMTTLQLDATEDFSVSPSRLTLVLKDQANRKATFSGIEFKPATAQPEVGWGLMAIVADSGVYRLLRSNGNVVTTVTAVVENGGPHWGTAGMVSFACNQPTTAGSCTSWDLNTPNDGGDVHLATTVGFQLWTKHRRCHVTGGRRTCTGQEGSEEECNDSAAAYRTNWLNAQIPGIPQSVAANFHVVPTYEEVVSSPAPNDDVVYSCTANVLDQPSPGTTVKNVCALMAGPAYTENGIYYDELSLWNRPITAEEFEAMGTYYSNDSSSDSLPKAAETVSPKDEQATGLAAHLLEAAAADLNLLAAYIDATRSAAYGQCYLGGSSTIRDAALDRIGRNLRLIALLEGEAQNLAATPGAASAPWFARYQAGRKILTSSRAKVVQQLALLQRCVNPLGISEQEIPLYIGSVNLNDAENFYAGTRYLVEAAVGGDGNGGLAASAISSLFAARAAYNQQIQADLALDQPADITNSIDAMKLGFETALRKFCGTPAGHESSTDHAVLDGFLANTMAATNCFIKERPECANVGSLPLSLVPTACLRGEVGERFAAIQGAYIDAANAKADLDRATELFDLDTQFCVSRKAQGQAKIDLLAAHLDTMNRLRELQRVDNVGFGIWQSVVGQSLETFAATGAQLFQSLDLQAQEDEEARYKIQAAKMELDSEVADCFHKSANDQFAVKAAADVMTRAAQQAEAALVSLDDARAVVTATATEAAGKIQLQTALRRIPPHLHYWLASAINTYTRDMTLTRRVTYLAMRAYEYEGQKSTDLRSTILAARVPEELRDVGRTLRGNIAPFQGNDGIVKQNDHRELSLRDEILRIENLATALHLRPGTPRMTAAEVFTAFLNSDSTKIYDRQTGQYLGHGIRFSLRPGGWADDLCAERLWRVTPLTSDGNGTRPHNDALRLYQENSFGSQACGGEQCMTDDQCASGNCLPNGSCAPGGVRITRFQPTANLISGVGAQQFLSPSDMTNMFVTMPPSNLGSGRDVLKDLSLGGPTPFTGRGLYGNYVLVFPPSNEPCQHDNGNPPRVTECQGWAEERLGTVTDVLLRFDVVHATVQHQVGGP